MKIELLKGDHVIATGAIGDPINKTATHIENPNLVAVLVQMTYRIPSASIGDDSIMFRLDHEAMLAYEQVENQYKTETAFRGIPVVRVA